MSNQNFVGEFQIVDLDSVRPNTWNPNRFTAFLAKSLEHGMRVDGWIPAQAMLIWGKDEHGAEQNIIIDGEHRWKAAQAIGLKQGPATYLDGITEAQAKAYTIKLDQKRGTHDEALLSGLLSSLDDVPDLDLLLGVPTPVLLSDPDLPEEEADLPIVYSMPNAAAEKLRELLLSVAMKFDLPTLSAAAEHAYRGVIDEV